MHRSRGRQKKLDFETHLSGTLGNNMLYFSGQNYYLSHRFYFQDHHANTIDPGLGEGQDTPKAPEDDLS
jgi:hypothetical protein